MDLLDITQCKKDLDFKPLHKKTDSLPSIAWNTYLITGFDRTHGTVLNIKTPLPQLLKDCYPNLSFAEISRFLERLESIEPLYFELKADILAAYHLKDHPELDELIHIVLSLGFQHQNWLAEKQMTPRELYPLRLLLRQKPTEAAEFIAKCCDLMRQKKATKAQAVKILELATDLFLMGQDPINEVARTAEIWLRFLEHKRYPQTRSFDVTQEEKVKRLPWPSHVQAKWIREGDHAGIEVKFNIHNSTELNKMIEGLESLSSQLNEDLWKSH